MLSKDDKKFLELYSDSEYEKPSVTVDAVVFRLASKPQQNYRKLPEKKLQVLLIKREYPPFKNKYSVPGTFIDLNFELSKSMELCLNKKVGLTNYYMEQLFTFGEKSRDPRTRVISTSFMILTNPTSEITNGKWFDIDVKEIKSNNEIQKKEMILTLKKENEILNSKIQISLKTNGISEQKNVELTENSLAFDHAKIIFYAYERLKNKLEYTDIIFNLMPKKFTLTELKMSYETILKTPLLDANFRRKIQGKVNPIDDFESGQGHRKSQYFIKKDFLDINNIE